MKTHDLNNYMIETYNRKTWLNQAADFTLQISFYMTKIYYAIYYINCLMRRVVLCFYEITNNSLSIIVKTLKIHHVK